MIALEKFKFEFKLSVFYCIKLLLLKLAKAFLQSKRPLSLNIGRVGIKLEACLVDL